MKSANKLWKESGTTLSFKEWIEREKKKFNSNEVSANALLGVDGSLSISNNNNAPLPKTVFGINKTVLIISGILIVSAIGFYMYKKTKNG